MPAAVPINMMHLPRLCTPGIVPERQVFPACDDAPRNTAVCCTDYSDTRIGHYIATNPFLVATNVVKYKALRLASTGTGVRGNQSDASCVQSLAFCEPCFRDVFERPLVAVALTSSLARKTVSACCLACDRSDLMRTPTLAETQMRTGH